MKADIHPTYYPDAKVKCACGNMFTVGSTQQTLEVEVCSACHPFYTGQDKLMDKVGRIQKFRERLAKKEAPKPKRVKVKKPNKTDEPRTDQKRVRGAVNKTH